MSNEVFARRARAPQFPQRRALKTRGNGPSPFAKGGTVPGFEFGGLFSGSPGSSTTTQSSQTENKVTDPYYTSLMDSVLNGAEGQLNTSKFKPYVGPNGETNPIVGLTPGQQQGITMAGSNVGNYQPFFDAAKGQIGNVQGAYDPNAGKGFVNDAAGMTTGSTAASPFLNQASQTFPGAMSQYMSPYTGSVVKGLQDASNRNFEQNTMRTINDTFSGGDAAQFGRERHGNAVGNAVFAKTQADDAAVANALETGYTTAGNLFNADQNRQLGVGQAAGSLANSDITTRAGLGQTAAGIQSGNTSAGIGVGQAQSGLGAATQQGGINDVNALEQTGAVAQGTQQNQSNFNYNQFQQQQQYPWQVLQAAQGLGQGWQLPTQSNTNSTATSTVQQPQGSPFGQILGGVMGAASLATPGAGGVSPGGNIFSGISGWFGKRDGGYLTPESQTPFAQGGMVPTIAAMRRRNQPMKLRGMQPTGMPQMPPMAGAPMAPPPVQTNSQLPPPGRHYAEGGGVDDESSPFDMSYDSQVPAPRHISPAPPILPAPLMNMSGGMGGGGGQSGGSGGMGGDPMKGLANIFKGSGSGSSPYDGNIDADIANWSGYGQPGIDSEIANWSGYGMGGADGAGGLAGMFGGIGDLGGLFGGGSEAAAGAGGLESLAEFLPMLALARDGGQIRGYDNGGMFLNASEGLGDRIAARDFYNADRPMPPSGGPYDNDTPSGPDKVMRDDPLMYLWRHLPPNVREALEFGRDMMPDKAIGSYVDKSRDMGRALMGGDPMETLGSGSDAALSMMGMMAPGVGRAANSAFNPLARRLAGAR